MSSAKQYHHYIPQFLLRNFANDLPSTRIFVTNPDGFTEEVLSDAMWKTWTHKINVCHIQQNKLLLTCELARNDKKSVRNYGISDLYADNAHPDRQHIEKLFSKLESSASSILRRFIDVARQKTPKTLEVVRKDLNTIRKFLYLMSYRNSAAANQFSTNNFFVMARKDMEKHIADNMDNKQAHGRDVWLQNIFEFLNSEVWDIPTNERIFIHDRTQYLEEMRARRIVFWRIPPSEDDEFVLSENAFGLYIGLSLLAQNAPAAPQLSALPSCILEFPFPGPLDLKYKGLSKDARRKQKQGWFEFTGGEKGSRRMEQEQKDGNDAPSTYIDGKIMESREDDIFEFPVADVTRQQIEIVNGLVLNSAKDRLTFQSPQRMYRYIRAYELQSFWSGKQDYEPMKRALRKAMMKQRL